MWGDSMENYIQLFAQGVGFGFAVVLFAGFTAWAFAVLVRTGNKIIK
jgi:hypothetical protein